jgi:serine/threonine protein phosphatase PrpC
MLLPEIDQPRRFADCHMESGESYRLGDGTVCIYSARAPGKDGPNEDAAAIIPVCDGAAVLAVADGVGGRPGGAEASLNVVQTLVRRVGGGVADTADLRDAILTSLEEANRRIITSGNGSATTLALVELHQGTLRSYHVGDSLVLVTGSGGRIKLETVSHSPVGYAVEAGLLTEREAISHDERHLVSNVIGSADMHISIGVRKRLAPRDTVLLATDGLLDNLHKDEIIARIRKGPIAECARQLAVLARRRMEGDGDPGKPDDLTFILYRPLPARRAARTQ